MAVPPLLPRVLAGLLLPLGLAITTPADAKCEIPEITLAPGSGTVPPSPVLWLMAPGWKTLSTPPRLAVRSQGVAVPFWVTPGTLAPELATFRVQVPGAVAGRLEVDILEPPHAGSTWSFHVDAGWRAPASSLATIETSRTDTQSSCSSQLTRDLRFAGDAPAYQVVVADTLANLGAGRTRQVVLPHDPARLWGAPGEARVNLALGSVNCYGATFAWGPTPVWLRVFALLPDGSEQPVNGSAIEVAPP